MEEFAKNSSRSESEIVSLGKGGQEMGDAAFVTLSGAKMLVSWSVLLIRCEAYVESRSRSAHGNVVGMSAPQSIGTWKFYCWS